MVATVPLRDGRTLEYADLGDPAGRPVLYFPGTPGTATQGKVVAEAARDADVRLVAVSRAGYGASTTAPPGLTSTASDALELADRLGLERIVAMGTSGGGPFALAVAALDPRRVGSVAVLGGVGDHREVAPEDLDDDDRRAMELLTAGDVEGAAAVLRGWSQTYFGPLQGRSAEEFHADLQRTRPPGENWFERRPAQLRLFEADFQRAITTFDGFVRDNLSWLGPWDVDLSAVTAPVRLVYGADDLMVPPAHGAWLHDRLTNSELSVVPGGHGHATFGAAEESFRSLGG
jgi:pimeloyl-ACP methyl ester carboxylesterase